MVGRHWGLKGGGRTELGSKADHCRRMRLRQPAKDTGLTPAAECDLMKIGSIESKYNAGMLCLASVVGRALGGVAVWVPARRPKNDPSAR